MTREQAREILQAYRPGRDDHEPLCVAALDLARRDPKLQAWLELEKEFDAAVGDKLKQWNGPDDLCAKIHHGVAARRRPRYWKQLLPLAACLALLAVLAGLWFGRANSETAGSFAACRADMAALLVKFPRLDVEVERHGDMRDWLVARHKLANVTFPRGLAAFPGIGCRTVKWHDKELALLCFMVDGRVVHLFVLRGGEFPDFPVESTPQFARNGEFNTASWRNGDIAYLAMTRGDQAFLRGHL